MVVSVWLGLVCLGLVAGCGSAAPPIADAPLSPSTERDPPSWTPAPTSEGRTGEPMALTLSGGAEQARALLTRLVEALRDDDEAAVASTLAERVAHAQPGLARTTWTRAALAHQMLAAAGASHVEVETPIDTLIDPASVRVEDAASHFDGVVPAGVDAGDQVVSFAPTALGRRLLAGLGSSVVVVRPGPTPLVVAR